MLRSNLEKPFLEVGATLWVTDPTNGRRQIYVKGTTFSGSAPRTTFGNTIRQGLYMLWACVLAGLVPRIFRWQTDYDCELFVAGDDVMVMCRRGDTARLISACESLFYKDKGDEPYGLG